MKTPLRIVIITGLSGSGKSTAIRALEDIGFFCVDNLPLPLLEQFITLASNSATMTRIALVIDVRERGFLDSATTIIDQLVENGQPISICFLESSDAVLIRRYQETRRAHPMQGSSLPQKVQAERALLEPLRQRAQYVLNTSGFNLYQLKKVIRDQFSNDTPQIRLSIQSFGFKFGPATGVDMLFDVRFLNNPYFVPELRAKSGLDDDIQRFVLDQPAAQQLQSLMLPLVEFVIRQTISEGRGRMTVAIGCTGGKHRSVSFVEWLHRELSASIEVPISKLHRDIHKISQ